VERKTTLEMNTIDVEELVESHSTELSHDELTEMQKEIKNKNELKKMKT
jgi:hypothetical protein